MPLSSHRHSQGFSLPEVMVSSLLLALVVANSTNLYMRTQGNIRSSSLRDAVNARIAEDLETLRRYSWEFGCEDGTDLASNEIQSPTSCSGQSAYADVTIAYKTGRTSDDNPSTPAPISAFQNACSNGSLASLMQSSQPTIFPTGATTLSLTSNNQAARMAGNSVTITREISVDSSDQNKLNVSYSTASSSPIQVQLNTTLIPQALGWCP